MKENGEKIIKGRRERHSSTYLYLFSMSTYRHTVLESITSLMPGGEGFNSCAGIEAARDAAFSSLPRSVKEVLVEAARSPSRLSVSPVGARRGGEEDERGGMLVAEAMRERLRLCETAKGGNGRRGAKRKRGRIEGGN